MMGKYVIESKFENTRCFLEVACENSEPYFFINRVDSLTPYTEPDMEQVRKEAYDKGYDDATAEIGSDEQAIAEKAYQRGLNDAWEAARKILSMSTFERIKVFGSEMMWIMLNHNSASEAIEKIRQYEQEKEDRIQIGDEVTPIETEYDDMIVTRLWKDDYDSDCIDAIGFDGRIGSFLVSRVSKTGKHYEIAEVLRKMKENE